MTWYDTWIRPEGLLFALPQDIGFLGFTVTRWSACLHASASPMGRVDFLGTEMIKDIQG